MFVSLRAVEPCELILLFVKLLGFYTVYPGRKLSVLRVKTFQAVLCSGTLFELL